MHLPDIRILHREALCEKLRQATERYRLIVLSAPMGYGKTTVVRELLPTLPQFAFYVAMIPGLHTPEYVWDRTCVQVAAQGSRLAPILQARGFPTTPGEVEHTLDIIRAHLKGRPTVMVYDDYHYVNAPDLDFFYDLFVRADIDDLCLFVISRTKPGFLMEELCLKGFAVEFDKSLLAFSQEETRSFFKLHGVDDPAIADAAWTYTEGWPSALWLSVQSYLTQGLLKPEHSVDKLLENIIFSRYSEDKQALLLKLSLMSRFSPRQAAFVMQDPSVPRKLVELHENNAFLNYDPITDAYSLHTLFRTFLKKKLEDPGREGKDGVDAPSLFRKLAQWHEREKDDMEAIKAYAQAGMDEDLLNILRIFEKKGDGHVVSLAPERIKALCGAIPWRVRYLRPIGYLAFIYHYMSRVSFSEGIPLLEEAEKRFMAEQSIPEHLHTRIEGELSIIKGIRAFNDIEAMHAHRARAHKLLGGPSSIIHQQMHWNFGCPSISFLYLRSPGMYGDFLHRVQSHIWYFQELTNGCSMGGQDLLRAEFFLEKGRLKQVESCVAKAVYRASAKGQRTTILCAKFTLARMYLARGRADDITALIEEVDSQYCGSATSLLAVSMELAGAYINACLEQVDYIPRWIRDGQEPSSSGFYHAAPFARIIQGKCLLLKKNWLHLEAFAQDLARNTNGYKHLFIDIHAKVLEAVAAYRLDGIDRAATLIAEALELARPDGLAMCMAEYGRHIRPLLRHHIAQNPADTFAEGVLRIAKCYAGQGAPQDSPQPKTHHAGLKEREITLLSLAAKGKSNNEIAQHLKLSEAAIKKSFSSIYRKLHVRNRAEAVQAFTASQNCRARSTDFFP